MTVQGPAFPISFSGEDGKENVMYNIYHGIFARETYLPGLRSNLTLAFKFAERFERGPISECLMDLL